MTFKFSVIQMPNNYFLLTTLLYITLPITLGLDTATAGTFYTGSVKNDNLVTVGYTYSHHEKLTDNA